MEKTVRASSDPNLPPTVAASPEPFITTPPPFRSSTPAPRSALPRGKLILSVVLALVTMGTLAFYDPLHNDNSSTGAWDENDSCNFTGGAYHVTTPDPRYFYACTASSTYFSKLAQRAAAAALTGSQDCVAEMREAYRRRRDLAVSLLKDRDRYVYTPHGAFYILVDITSPDGTPRRGRQFALDLLRERNVAVAAGNNFGAVAVNYVRISLAASEEDIERGVREIGAFADR